MACLAAPFSHHVTDPSGHSHLRGVVREARIMVITIDGPAGTGKSTVAQLVAQRLGLDFLDTGAMYRAVGLEALRRRANLQDTRELTFIAKHVKIDFDWSKQPPVLVLNGEPVGHLL